MTRTWKAFLLCLAITACANPDYAPSTLLDRAGQTLRSGDDVVAYGQVAYAIANGNPAESSRGIAMIRSEPRLQAAMEKRMAQVAAETYGISRDHQRFMTEFPGRYEVRVYVRVKELNAEQQRSFLDAAWKGAIELAQATPEKSIDTAQSEAEAAAMALLRREAILGSRVTCANDIECRKAFALAQIYVLRVSDMKIQLATDTIIETYNPTETGRIGSKVIKTPGAGQSAQIDFDATCRECGSNNERRVLNAMKEFRTYIEAKLKE